MENHGLLQYCVIMLGSLKIEIATIVLTNWVQMHYDFSRES